MMHETDEQAKLWKGVGGQGWVEAEAILDQMFKPFEDLLVEVVSARSRGAVLDVGCGTGSTTLAFARVLGPVARILQDVDHRTHAQIVETVPAAFDPCVKGTDVRFTAACWMVGARA